MLKPAGSTGAFHWHQDYGYWYSDGCPFPRMMSVMVALDPATRDNGCLQVLAGSQALGRLDHGRTEHESAADQERVALLAGRFEHRDVELAPGDALAFDCLTLHASAPNPSEGPRRALIVSFNRMDNVPVGGPGHGAPIAL
jgi:ectoine hydroxylase-related dioxygenase (phytanoyl-CoA dioxygenase family)